MSAFMYTICLALFVVSFFPTTESFRSIVTTNVGRARVSMEYIPDGLSKAQWEKMKAEEAKKNAGKDLGKVGITKFKSRSFEAWQKDGQKHLFPVDPKTPLAERPYMQRLGGVWDARDIKGLNAKGQAAAMKFTDVDKKYEEMEKAAAAPKPVLEAKDKKGVPAKAGKTTPVATQDPPKKGFFGLF